MSIEGLAWAKKQHECPDGAELTSDHKHLLLLLGDEHSEHRRIAWPSQTRLAEVSHLSMNSVRRALDYLEAHCVIEVRRPENQGRGQFTVYVLLSLDEPERLRELLARKSEGALGGPLFQHPEGAQKVPKRCPEGAQIGPRNKEVEQEQIQETKAGKQPPQKAGLSAAERDSWDLRRWREEMNRLEEAKVGVQVNDDVWTGWARTACYRAGVTPARIREILVQLFPDDPAIERLTVCEVATAT